MNLEPNYLRPPTTNKLRLVWALTALSITLSGGCYQSSLNKQTAPTDATTLNSERIRQRFDSYGIELLHQDPELRVSNLYSTETDRRTCRTLAIVRFGTPIPAELSVAHAQILAGGSIGEVLSRDGWQVQKRRLDLIQIDVGPGSQAATLMQLTGPALLATDVYELSAHRRELGVSYAVIAEIHHPDYMTLPQLRTQELLPGHHPDAAKLLRLAEQIATQPVGIPRQDTSPSLNLPTRSTPTLP